MRPGQLLAVTLLAIGLVSSAFGRGSGAALAERETELSGNSGLSGGSRAARLETLWIFDADFGDQIGDNAGWTSYDLSGTLGFTNYWHHDTIRLTEPYLGSSTWWCGTYSNCWEQPRGYGNEWFQTLERAMTEVAGTAPGDTIELEFDQRYAMEKNYDYGYVEVKTPDVPDWTTLAAYTNTGFFPAPGHPHDWDHATDGHVTLNLSYYAGDTVEVRYRFESDLLYSSQDTPDNSAHSVKDGAWQLDNITITQNGTPIFSDDSESGNMGWLHDDVPSSGQTATTWFRGQYGTNFVTGRPVTCGDPPVGTWMYAGVDPFTSTMVDGEFAYLMGPPIDISGTDHLVGQWHIWGDCPDLTDDNYDFRLASSDLRECVTQLEDFINPDGYIYYTAYPAWYLRDESWDAFAGNDWLAIAWLLWDNSPGEEPHRAGVFLNRQRVGVPVGDPGAVWEWGFDRFYDCFQDDLAEAVQESAEIRITDNDGIVSAHLIATNGTSTTSYPLVEFPYWGPDWWRVPPPVTEMLPGSEIHYYLEAIDGAGNVWLYPTGAPDEHFEMSILPLEASVSHPGILLVDKLNLRVAGNKRDFGGPVDPARRDYSCCEYYYREALEILGYDCDTFDALFGTLPVEGNLGPDTTGLKYYHTVIWFSGTTGASSALWPIDQWNLIQWLSQAEQGKERNLLLTGNQIGYELFDAGKETLSFYTTWLASEYVADAVGVAGVDSVPGLVDHAGGFDFITLDDGECIVAGGCPDPIEAFDVVDARAGVVGNEVVADYEREDLTTVPAGVAYTHPTMGYQTVNLGFGIHCMMDGTNPDNSGNYTPEGYYHTGVADRVDLIGNIMQYFGLSPGGTGTGVAEGGVENTLSHAWPNPFNPVTRIDYSVREGGPVAIEIYSVAGRVVRRLLSDELEAGASGSMVWDGTNEAGERCASGVYFYRIVAPGFTASRRMVLLK